MRRSPRQHRQLAWLALIAWLGGFELLPGVHLAAHALLPAHRHDAGEAPPPQRGVRVVKSRLAEQRARHAELVGHHHVRSPGVNRPDEHGSGPAPGHGAHSLLHRGVASLAATSFAFLPPRIAPVDAPASTLRDHQISSASIAALRARAPPAFALV